MPCLVTTLKTAPGLLPYSADAPSETTSISSMTSVSGHGHAAPDTGAVKSTPSHQVFVLVPPPSRTPRPRLLEPLVGFVADIPGALFVKSKKLKPAERSVLHVFVGEVRRDAGFFWCPRPDSRQLPSRSSETVASPSTTARSVVPPTRTTIPSSR